MSQFINQNLCTTPCISNHELVTWLDMHGVVHNCWLISGDVEHDARCLRNSKAHVTSTNNVSHLSFPRFVHFVVFKFIILGYDAASLDDLFPMFGGEVVVSKRRGPITHWRSAIPQAYENPSYNAAIAQKVENLSLISKQPQDAYSYLRFICKACLVTSIFFTLSVNVWCLKFYVRMPVYLL